LLSLMAQSRPHGADTTVKDNTSRLSNESPSLVSFTAGKIFLNFDLRLNQMFKL